MPGSKQYLDELWVGIKADLSDLSAGLKKGADEVHTFVGKIGQNSEQFKKFGTVVTGVSAALTAMGTVAMNTFAKFEQAMANTYSVLGAGEAEMKKLSDYAKELGQSTVFSATKAGQAMYWMASAGYNTGQVMDALQGILQLSAATQYDLSLATSTVMTVMNAFKLNASQTTRVANVFASSIAASQAEMDKLSESFKFVSTPAANLGLGLEETTAALSLLYDAGLEANQAGTSLRQILVRLQAPTKEARDLIKGLGISMKDIDPAYNSIAQIIRTFEKAGAGAKDKGGMLARIFDVRAAGAFQILLRNGADALNDMERRITGTDKAASMAKIQLDTFKGSMTLLIGKIQNLAITFGEILAPALRTVAEVLGKLIVIINQLPSGIKTFIVYAIAITTAVTGIIGPISLLIGMLPKMAAVFSAAMTVMNSSAGIIGLIAIAITGLVAGIGYLVSAEGREEEQRKKNLSTIKESIDKQILERENVGQLADEYVKLMGEKDGATVNSKRLHSILTQLQAVYPDLIQNTEDYAGQLDNVKKMAGSAAEEVKKLYEQKMLVRQVELNIDIAESRKKIEELKENINNPSWWSKNVKGVFTDKLDIKGMEKEISQLAGKTYDIISQNTKAVNGAMSVNPVWLTNAVGQFSQYEGNMSSVLAAMNNFQNRSNELELERQKINSQALKDNRQLTTEEEARIGQINAQKGVFDSLSNAYLNGTSSAKELHQETLKLLESQKELNGLSATPIKKTITTETAPDADLSEEEKEKVKKAAEEKRKLLNSMETDMLKQQVAELKAIKDRSLQQELDIEDKEYAIKMANRKTDYEDALAKAEETGVKKELIDNTFKQREKAEEKEHQNNIYQIRKDYSDKEFELMGNKLEYEGNMNNQLLMDYRQNLEYRLTAVKQWSDEYMGILRQIQEVDKMINLPKENKIKYRAQMEMQSNDEGVPKANKRQYEGALQIYRQFLQDKLAAETLWSDEYIALLNEINSVETEIRKHQLEDIKVQTQIATGVMDGLFNHLWSTYIESGRKAKNEMDAIWLSIKNAALKALADVLQSQITNAVVSLMLKLLGGIGTVGSTAISNLNPAADMVGDPNKFGNIAAVGAEVKTSGAVIAHPGEVIVPASLVRKNYNDYEKAMDGSGASKAASQPTNNHFSFVLQNPIVNDNVYWEKIMKDHIIPATETMNKRYGK
jgi:TP901 family phage tail tape measure protein